MSDLRKNIDDLLKNAFLGSYVKLKHDHKIKHSNICCPNEYLVIQEALKLDGFASAAANLTPSEDNVRKKLINTIKLTKPHDVNVVDSIVETEGYKKLWAHYNEETVSTEPVIFNGLKGSGKTSTLNLFIAKMNSNFLEESDCLRLVIRGNAEEYTRIRSWVSENYSGNHEKYDLELTDYMMLRSAYTFVRYINQPIFRQIFEELKSYPCRILHSGFKGNSSEGTVEDIIMYMKDQLKITEKGEGSGGGLFRILKDPLKERARGADSKSDKDFYTLAQRLQQYCEEKNGLMIYVLDGIDNCYSFNKEDRESYERMVGGVASYFESSRSGTPIVRYLIACRPETEDQIRKRISGSIDKCPIIPFSNTPKEIEQILDEKNKAFVDELVAAAIKERKQDASDYVDLILHSWLEYQRFCIKLLSDAGHTLSTSDEIVTLLFCDNIRTYLYNFVAYTTLKRVFIRNQGAGIYTNSPSQDALFRLFIFNLFSGGRNYVDTRRAMQFGQSNLGALLPNPFIYRYPLYEKPLVSNIMDHVLLSLQLMSKFDKAQSPDVKNPEQIVDDLISEFPDYNRSVIEEIYTRFFQFRIIEKNEEESMTFTIDQLSNLGSILKYILNNHSPIYSWLALDSICSSEMRDEFLCFGINDFDMKKSYWRLNLILGIRFLARLQYAFKVLDDSKVAEITFMNLLDDMTNIYTGLIQAKQLSLAEVNEWVELVTKELKVFK